ncbi:hypothetical protein HYU95_03925 [Candidatus Daviesbacteria bacterium]|nr:hypothetical protein [Candidatus Daviesbacteria bacterium]
MQKTTPELVRHWLSEGYSKQAVAGYGNSVEFLQKAVESGEIPWNASFKDPDLLPYQKQLLKKGGYLYYAYPFIDQLQPLKPRLVNKLYNNLDPEDLSKDAIRPHLLFYAAYNAIPHQFHSYTGIQVDGPHPLIALTHLLFPDLVTQCQDDILQFFFDLYKDSADWQEPSQLGLAQSNLSLPQLKEILAQAISRRGVILYYNQQLTNYHLVPGIESDKEIMIHSKEPLTLEVISGIEPLSKSDQEAVENLICKLEPQHS